MGSQRRDFCFVDFEIAKFQELDNFDVEHSSEVRSPIKRSAYWESTHTDDSDSDLQANDSRRELLESNRELSRRLANLEDRFDASSILSRRKSHAWSQIHQQDDTGSKLAGTFFRQAHDKNSIPTSESSVLRFEFESDLEASRVYRKAQRDTVDFSFRSSIARTHTWSTLSDLSLSDISAISVIALPMYSSDITNGYHYEFGAASPELPGGEPTAMPMEPGTSSKSDTRARDGSPPPPAANPTTVSKTVSKGYAKSPYLREYKLVVGGRGADKSQLVTRVSETSMSLKRALKS